MPSAQNLPSGPAAKAVVKRVAIVDWDVHHGNGTQHIFDNDPNVLFISLHRFGKGFFPGTGAIDEVGVGAGRGRTVNVPWMQAGLGDADYAAAFALVVMPILREFDPHLLFVSAGFDAAEGDVQGKMRMTPNGFVAMLRQLFSLHTLCAPVVVFEGGYHLEQSAACAKAVLAEMLAHADAHAEEHAKPEASTGVIDDANTAATTKCVVEDTAAATRVGSLGTHTEALLRQVISVQRDHWACLRSEDHATSVEVLFGQRGTRGCRKRGR